jgi:hypothetical protein
VIAYVDLLRVQSPGISEQHKGTSGPWSVRVTPDHGIGFPGPGTAADPAQSGADLLKPGWRGHYPVQRFVPEICFGEDFALVWADLVAVVFFVESFAGFCAAVFGLALTLGLEAVAAAFWRAFEILADAFGVRFLDDLEAVLAFFCEVLAGIIFPTACMALEPASMTTSAAEAAASPICWRTPFDFLLFAIGLPSKGFAFGPLFSKTGANLRWAIQRSRSKAFIKQGRRGNRSNSWKGTTATAIPKADEPGDVGLVFVAHNNHD